MLKNLKFIYKILVFPLLFSIIFLFVFIGSSHFMKKNNQLLNDSRNNYFPSIELSIKLNNTLTIIQRSLQDAVASAEEERLEETDTIAKEFTKLCLLLNEHTKSDRSTDSLINLFTSYYSNAKNISVAMINGNFTQELSDSISIMIEQYNNLDSIVKNIETANKAQLEKHFASVDKNSKRQKNSSTLLFLVGILLTLLITFFITKAIINPLKKAVFYIQEISSNKINFKIDEERKDEIGDLFKSINTINNNFNKIINNLKITAQSVLDASNQLSSLSIEISERATEQSATTEEVTASIEQIQAMISSNSEKADKTRDSTTKTANEIKENAIVFNQTIDSVSKISKKVSIISEIAETTDILSINAAIEAAKSGDIGRGFAVVAKEIRKLADNTKSASDEIAILSTEGNSISNIANKKLNNLIPEIIESAKLVQKIVEANNEQLTGIQAINESMIQLSDSTNHNSASAEEMSSSAEELTEQAEQLKKMISVFEITKNE